MTRRIALTALAWFVIAALSPRAAERDWKEGTWRQVAVERPRISFGVATRDPNSNVPRAATAREVRKYVIETASERYELWQDATADTPRIVAVVGQPVLFAIEKKAIYLKDDEGIEYKLVLRKRTTLSK